MAVDVVAGMLQDIWNKKIHVLATDLNHVGVDIQCQNPN